MNIPEQFFKYKKYKYLLRNVAIFHRLIYRKYKFTLKIQLFTQRQSTLKSIPVKINSIFPLITIIKIEILII